VRACDGRAIVNKISVKFESNEGFSLNDADIYLCYRDLLMGKNERMNSAYCDQRAAKQAGYLGLVYEGL